MKTKKGLTLIELLAVIAIIAILFVLLVPQISNGIKKARETGVITDFRDYERALKSHQFENEPLSEESLNRHLDKSLRFVNGRSIKENPYGNKYELLTTEEGFTIATKGETIKKVYMMSVTKNGEVKNNMNDEVIQVKGKIISGPPESEVLMIDARKEEFTYVDVTGGIKIESYIGENQYVRIPSKIDGKDVVEIGSYAFLSKKDFPSDARAKSNTKIKQVEIPNTVKIIGEGAFNKNDLVEVTIPNSVVNLGRWSFQENKIERVNLSLGITELTSSVFAYNNIKDLVIPNNIIAIGPGAFLGNKIETLKLNEGLRMIYASAFEKNEIKTLTIPTTLQTISANAFFENPNLKSVINKSSLTNAHISGYFNSNPNITN